MAGPSIQRAETIRHALRVFLALTGGDESSVASVIARVLFENAMTALSAEEGLTREELLNRAEFVDRSNADRTIGEDDLNRDIPRITRRIQEFNRLLPGFGIKSIAGPTRHARGDELKRLWLRFEFSDPRPPINVMSPTTIGARLLDDVQADLVGELAIAFAFRYIDVTLDPLPFRQQRIATRLVYELLHLCAREARHRCGLAAIRASTEDLRVLARKIGIDGEGEAVWRDLETLSEKLRSEIPWEYRQPVLGDNSPLFFDGALTWTYTRAHRGRFEMLWRFWYVYNDERRAELTTADDLTLARSISEIPFVELGPPVGEVDGFDDDPVLASLAHAMRTRMAERRDARLSRLLQIFDELRIKIVARLRTRRRVVEKEVETFRARQLEVEQTVAGIVTRVQTDGALALHAGGRGMARESRSPLFLAPVFEDTYEEAETELNAALAYFSETGDDFRRLLILLDHSLSPILLAAQLEQSSMLRDMARRAGVAACRELAHLGVVTLPIAFYLAQSREVLEDAAEEELMADGGGPNPAVEAVRRARLAQAGVQHLLYSRASSLAPHTRRLPAAAALAAVGRAIVRFFTHEAALDFSIVESLDRELRLIARILERYKGVSARAAYTADFLR